MGDRKPVDVRLAEALGWTSLDYDADRNIWEGWNPDKGLPDWPRYSRDYAWCGEIADLNGLICRRFHPTGPKHLCWQPHGSLTSVISDLGWRRTICEWVIAAIAAGVRVVLPGGRVIEGRAA